MKRIYKYEVPSKVTAKVEKWLQPKMQYGRLMIWALLDDDAEEKEWYIYSVGTGWEMSKNLNKEDYCGTVEDDEGYIWHIFASEKGKFLIRY